MSCVNAYNNYSASFILKVAENDGNLLWSKKYSTTGDHLTLSNLLHMYNNELYIGGTFREDNLESPRNILMKTNSDGNILNTVSLINPATGASPQMLYLQPANGNIYMSSVYYSTPPFSNPRIINVTVNTNLDIIKSKNRPSVFNHGPFALAIGAGEQLYETGWYGSSYYYYGYIYLAKFSPDGSVGTCPSDSLPLQQVIPSPLTVTNLSFVQSDSAIAIRVPVYRADQFFLATSKLVCASVPGCNSLDIVGTDSICDKSLQYTFRAVRNSGCSAPLQWLYDDSNTQLINQTDSSITLRFLNAGSLLLKARFTSNCIPYTDSLLIHIIGDAPLLDLGADTSLCPGAGLLLNAKKGFRSYLWQDGSADSTFTVTAAGLYYVNVTDSCNNTFTDSINVQINGNGPILNLGPDSNFCNTNTIQLNAHTGFLSYLWQDGSVDSTFTATQPGSYYITVTDACGNIFSDTIKIKSYRRAASLNLGTDTIFCGSVAMLLNAGTGFHTYLWQDGSAGSTFMALTTGLYYVQVTDSCGSVFTDSIRISPDNTIAFDIGPDTLICKYDSLLLQATPGLNNYTWWPQLNMIPQGPTAVSVFPNTGTWYHVSAIKPNGCLVKDSIRIDVHTPLPINLGADSSICAGDTLQLNAVPGFNNYTWSTGAHTVSIPVYQAGQYFVSATDNNNCVSSDSVMILAIIPLPVTQLPAETSVCKGQPMALHAGTGFINYLWNTGALTESIIVSSMGQYWVNVTNSFGCIHTDTVRINSELALPSDFIKDKEYSICVFENIIIGTSQNYTAYLWSNGFTTPTITINNAGDYWLKITDANGCIGSDSFTLVKKDCNIDVFFPNSFTPNNDGLNDTYKPKAYGRINFYHMIIHNRYGEKLFESRNIEVGWDGTYKGVKQETGAFIFQCWYQLGSGSIQNKFGSVLLIR